MESSVSNESLLSDTETNVLDGKLNQMLSDINESQENDTHDKTIKSTDIHDKTIKAD